MEQKKQFFKLVSCGDMLGDCTSNYDAELLAPFTIGDLRDWLKDSKEWGDVVVYTTENKRIGKVLEYKNGEIQPIAIDEVKGWRVAKMTANGGWGRMDYCVVADLKTRPEDLEEYPCNACEHQKNVIYEGEKWHICEKTMSLLGKPLSINGQCVHYTNKFKEK